MADITLSIDYVIGTFRNLRASTMEAAEALYHASENKLWEGSYESFSDFVENGIGISKGYASVLLQVYKHFILEGGLSQEQVQEVDASKLYLAIKLNEPVEKKVEIAKILSRRDLKLEKNEVAPHEHQPICRICHLKLV